MSAREAAVRSSAALSVTVTAALSVAVAVAVLVLAGCGGPPPVATPDLAAELPPAWTARDAGAPGATAPWWRSFDDDALHAAVEEALAHNHDLAAAAARLDAAAAEARIAGADVFPALNGGGSAARQQQVLTFLRDPQTGAPFKNMSNSYGVNLSLSWELDLWGRLSSAKSAAAADLQASMADLEGARQSIAAQTMKAWFAVVEAGRQLALAEATAASFRSTAERVRARYETGVRPSIDVRLALVDQANAEATLAARRSVHDRTLRQLELLLGRYPAAALAVAGDLAAPPGDVPAGLPADLLARRPDLVAAERRLAAANRRVASSRRALLPRLSLTASAGRGSDELGDLLKGDFSVWSLAGNLLQPIFQGGRLRAQVARSRAVEDVAVAQWADAVLTACAEVEALLAAETHLREQERAVAAAAEQARAARDLARERYESGLADVITLLQSQRSAAAAESALLEVRRRRLEARVDLHLALGGDFDAAGREERNAS